MKKKLNAKTSDCEIHVLVASMSVMISEWGGVGKQKKGIIISSVNGWAGMNRWGIPEVDQLLEQLGSSASQDAPECCSAPRRH